MPANIGIVANAPNKAGAEAFIEFLLSPAGQNLLFDPGIRRLPVNPSVYDKAPKGYPNPFTDPRLNSMVKFDVKKSEGRGEVVDALYDQTVTFQLADLKQTKKAIDAAAAAVASFATLSTAKADSYYGPVKVGNMCWKKQGGNSLGYWVTCTPAASQKARNAATDAYASSPRSSRHRR